MKTTCNFLVTLTLTLLSNILYSQSVSDNINTKSLVGWENLTWGMTEEDVKNKCSNRLKYLDKYDEYTSDSLYCPFKIENYELSYYKDLSVSFLFHLRTKKLERVFVILDNPENVLSIVRNIKSTLENQYGKVHIAHETENFDFNWIFPNLIIDFQHDVIKFDKNVLLNRIFLSFRKPSKDLVSKIKKESEKNYKETTFNASIYEMYPTENYWTFLKLDTRNGKIWQVHFNINEGFEGVVDLNSESLTFNDQEIQGRFRIIPTKNMYNFLLLDQLTGRTYQVQWNTELLNRSVTLIW